MPTSQFLPIIDISTLISKYLKLNVSKIELRSLWICPISGIPGSLNGVIIQLIGQARSLGVNLVIFLAVMFHDYSITKFCPFYFLHSSWTNLFYRVFIITVVQGTILSL